MNKNQKRKLYESIMLSTSKVIKKNLMKWLHVQIKMY